MDLQYKTPKGIEVLSNNNIINRDKKIQGATGIDDPPTSFVFKHNNLDKIIDDLLKIIREHFIDLPKQ